MRPDDHPGGSDERLLHDLRRLAEGPAPPERLEGRVVSELRERGLLAATGSRRRRVLAAAAALVLFLAGMLAGRAWSGSPAAEDRPAPRFALLLLGGVERGPDEARRVEEYRAWADELARAGRLAAGEKLGPDAWLLAGTGDGSGGVTLEAAPAAHRAAPLSGFFLLSVEDPAEALEIARSCPHLRHGGRVLLRPIEET